MAAPGAYGSIVPALASHAEADGSREVCGFVVADRVGGLSVVPARNVARSPRVAYEVDPAAHLALQRRLRAEGGRIAAVYHSHLHGPARLSEEDLRNAVDGGAPDMPGVDQIVVALRDGKVVEVKAFAWSGAGFVEAPLGAVPARDPGGGVAHRVAADARGAKSQPT